MTLIGADTMRAYVNDEHCEGIDPPVKHARIEHGDTLYVHLCSGQVIEVRPATEISVSDDALDVFNQGDLVRTFPRRTVYFAADQEMEPPSLK
jgi:hypothetical protein